MHNPFTGKHIEYHILQSFPVTCLNRDDVGAPKTAVVGGVSRARVSSQCWKRHVRLDLHQLGVRLGVRTKKINQVLRDACLELGADADKAESCGTAFLNEIAKDTLFFFSHKEAAVFADFFKKLAFEADKIKEKKVKTDLTKQIQNVAKSALDGLDIALFGRMVAQAPEMNIDGAASFAHALSTHKSTNEVEFFTALDDLQDEPGSAHMGSLEYNSATYYRYVSLDLGQLCENLSPEDLPTAVEVFTKALYSAVPAARQRTQSGACFWDYARIYVRKGQRLQASFDKPVRAAGEGWLAPSITALENFLKQKEQQAGSMFGKELEITLGPDMSVSIDDIIAALKKAVS
jgi:CRISPR system Cascade subunit CasC